MRISDWSSDVCSSDLRSVPIEGRLASPRTLRAVPLLWNTPDSYHAVDTTTLAASDATDKQIDDFRQLNRDPESLGSEARAFARSPDGSRMAVLTGNYPEFGARSEEHTSELQ